MIIKIKNLNQEKISVKKIENLDLKIIKKKKVKGLNQKIIKIKNLNLKRNLKIEKDLKTLLSKVREIKKEINYSVVLYLLLFIINTNSIGSIKVNKVTTINSIPSSE